MLTTQIGSYSSAFDGLLQPDGKVVAAGFSIGNGAHVALARYQGDTPDPDTPDTTLIDGPSGPTNITAPEFKFSASLPASTFESRLDTPAGAGSYAPCTSPQQYATTANGEGGTVSNVNVRVAGSRPGGDAIAVHIAGVYGPCGSPRTYSGLPAATYTLSVRGIDRVGQPYPTDPATRSFTVATAPDSETGPLTGPVPSTLTLSLSAPGSLGAFLPGVAKEYETSVAATVTSSAGDAALSVADAAATSTGRLTNGAFALTSPVQARAPNGANPNPVFAPVTIGLKQAILAPDGRVQQGPDVHAVHDDALTRTP